MCSDMCSLTIQQASTSYTTVLKSRTISTTLCRYSSSNSTQKYVRRQMTDEFSIKAREHSYRARSAFKLLEMDHRFKFLKPDSVVLDVGCAPGSWSQVVVERCQLRKKDTKGFLLGIDLQMVLPISAADIMSLSDVTSPAVQEMIKKKLNGRTVDVVLSDMAPNPTGDGATDHRRLIDLCRTVFSLFHTSDTPVFELSKHGVYVCKIWDGDCRKEFMSQLNDRFKYVKTVKPMACRDNSAELYLYCSNSL